MQIGNTNSAAYINYNPQTVKRDMSAMNQEAACDKSQTSKQALILSRSLATLNDELQPRAEVLEKFSGQMDTPIDFSDTIIDGIMDGIFNA